MIVLRWKMPEMSGDDESPEILITAPLTKWLEVEFNDAASIFPSAMLFADADNDGVRLGWEGS